MSVTLAGIDFGGSAEEVARALIGATLLIDGVGGMIVETEAYDQTDPASHTFTGQTPRNAMMFAQGGLAYVYRSYGLHWCLNFVCGPQGYGSGALIRAIDPTAGVERMRQRRGVEPLAALCSGPGRLCQALGVDGSLNGAPLWLPPFELVAPSGPAELVVGGRIGISKAVDTPWRFGLKGSKSVSKPFRAQAGPAA